ncbi:MAG: hypothetical protein ACOC5T_04530 [Elusimicrobiota bacterium]
MKRYEQNVLKLVMVLVSPFIVLINVVLGVYSLISMIVVGSIRMSMELYEILKNKVEKDMEIKEELKKSGIS